MKGVIDMDEINFCVIIKGVGCFDGRREAGSNTVATKVSKEKYGVWEDILDSME